MLTCIEVLKKLTKSKKRKVFNTLYNEIIDFDFNGPTSTTQLYGILSIARASKVDKAWVESCANDYVKLLSRIDQEKAVEKAIKEAIKVPDGNHKDYYENEDLKLDFNYKNGVQHGVQKEFYKGGQINIIANYKKGKLHGLREQYYPSGNLENRAKYVNGLMEGVYIYLKDNGDVIEEKIFHKGIDISMQLMSSMMQDDKISEIIRDGTQKRGESSQRMYDYYLANKKDMKSVNEWVDLGQGFQDQIHELPE